MTDHSRGKTVNPLAPSVKSVLKNPLTVPSSNKCDICSWLSWGAVGGHNMRTKLSDFRLSPLKDEEIQVT